jgi:hypothetical protein
VMGRGVNKVLDFRYGRGSCLPTRAKAAGRGVVEER